MKLEGPLVSAEWLAQNLDLDQLLVLNATLPKVTENKEEQLEESLQIPGTRFFDIKNRFSDPTAPFPNTMLQAQEFSEAARSLGVKKNSVLVVYDEYGIYSGARAWWMFRAMGHQDVAVLNGGLLAWKAAGLPLEKKQRHDDVVGDFEGEYNPSYFKNYSQVLDQIEDPNSLIIDARGENRFLGRSEEPRKGLRSGHIPKSVNLPYANLLQNGHLLLKDELINSFKKLNPENKNMTFSCGSGITACVLALGAELAEMEGNSVYDGSWTEWGSLDELPVEKG